MKKGIIGILSGIAGIAAGAGTAGRVLGKQLNKQSELSQKHLALYMLMNQWVQVKQDGKSLDSYFEKYEYKKIAVYGMNFVGQTLCKELEGSHIQISYAIDKNAENIYADFDVVTLEDNLEDVDAVIVTPIYYFDEIEEQLASKMSCPIISMEDILYEV
ncbi:MAG: hypothetical protein HFH79_04000 [Lachnospiraceae bacterium]|nr:hypothetical protein [Lachnospiraceae bacterium]